ncbi:hypothetical protein [Ruminococcus flavefaciens]|uniref:hypothetical protein n=1 Tax=Ruminococcus flavefaciens TaxID=1265 RepID=UPI0026EDF3C9|nr:hypothetical protein [Ruminococcus flavefaciens]MDD7515401.1 hypothetical protein [Ruminococcus flavefaciens]MDY5690658.1 hypothetical protein [Ruminococcus flavefaciens]
MEFILVIIIVSVLAVILGVKLIWLLFGAAAIIAFLFAASMILLTVFFIRLLFAKRHKGASFSRIDKSPRSSFKVAYYIIDGTEYPCIFPEEGFFRSKLYRSDKSCTVFLTRNKKYVYDKFACTTCTIGFLLSIVSVIAGFLIYQQF